MGYHRRALSLALLAAVQTGCPCPCPSLEQAQVWDPHDAAKPEQVRTIQHTIEDFAAWTGVSDLCVLGVKIRPILWPDAGAMYQGDGEWIIIEPDSLGQAARGVRHELCHAWDAYQGWPSVDTPEVFPPSDIDKVINYWSDEARSRESFAGVCEQGPYDVGISQGLERACGLDLMGRRKRWVTDYVFVDYPLTWAYQGELELQKSVVPLPDHDWYIDVVTDDEQLIALVADAADLPFGTAWFGAPPHDHGDGATTDFPPTTSFQVVTIDPTTGEELSSMDVSELIHGSNHGITLLSGGAEPLLLGVGDDATRGWRIDPSAGTTRKVHLPRLGSDPWAGVARGDHAWLVSNTLDDRQYHLRQVDLTTGQATEVLDRDGATVDYDYGTDAATLLDFGEALLLGQSDGYRSKLLRIDPERGSVHRGPLSDLEYSYLTAITAVPDGRLLAELLVVTGAYETEPEFHTFLLLMDPENNTWWIDPVTCGSDWEEELGFDGSVELITIRGQPYTIAGRWDEQGLPTRALIRLGLPD